MKKSRKYLRGAGGIPAQIERLETRLLFSAVYNVSQWIASTQGNALAQQTLPIAAVDTNVEPRTILLDPTLQYQTITGFGGAVSEQGWEALSTLNTSAQAAVLESLFTSSGTAFTYIRTPIGANDFSDNYYSLDDTPGDYSLSNISIARDQQKLIPFIRAALALNPNIQVWASPWTPPAWMKTNNQYNGGSLTWTPQTLQCYADYLANYVQAYQAVGIPVYAIHVQNEPVSAQPFPSALWTGSQMGQFIANYLGPTFTQRQITAQIWLGTINDDNYSNYGGVVLADPTAAAYVKGIGYQWAGQAAIATARQANPTLPIMQTESPCGDGTNSWAGGQATFNFLLQDFAAGANSYMYWNLVLNETATSTWGWQQNAMITVNRPTGAITYNPDYYAMDHFAHYIQPGAKLISATANDWGDKAAFLNPDGTIVVEIGNSAPQSYTDTLRLAGDTYATKVTLAPNSLNTFILSPSSQFLSSPTGLAAMPGKEQIALSWNLTPGATSYHLKRATTSGGPYTTIATGLTSTNYLDTGLTNGRTYYYVLSAVNANLESANSSQVSAIPTAIAPGISIDSGGGAAGSFVADTDVSGGNTFSSGSVISTTGVVNPAPQAVYQTERYGNFTYTVPGLSANQPYVVRLHFAENYWSTAGSRLFNVLINGTPVLNSFDIFAAAGGRYSAVVRQFTVHANASGTVTIQYVSVKDNAKSSGIEIIPNLSRWTGQAGDHQWNNPGNWLNCLVPTATDEVTIGSGFAPIQVASGNFSLATLFAGSPLEITATGILALHGTATLSAGLTVDSGGKLQFAIEHSLLVAGGGLSIAPGGILDLRSSDLIVLNGDQSVLTGYLKSGYNNGTWTGTSGIVSSYAALPAHHYQGFGMLSGQDYEILFPGKSVVGYTPQAGDVVVQYTYLGDADLNGRITGIDLAQIDAAYLLRTYTNGGACWINGDCNYDGKINLEDFTLINAALIFQASQPLTEVVASVVAVTSPVIEPPVNMTTAPVVTVPVGSDPPVLVETPTVVPEKTSGDTFIANLVEEVSDTPSLKLIPAVLTAGTEQTQAVTQVKIPSPIAVEISGTVITDNPEIESSSVIPLAPTTPSPTLVSALTPAVGSTVTKATTMPGPNPAVQSGGVDRVFPVAPQDRDIPKFKPVQQWILAWTHFPTLGDTNIPMDSEEHPTRKHKIQVTTAAIVSKNTPSRKPSTSTCGV